MIELTICNKEQTRSIFSQTWERVLGDKRDERRKKDPRSRKARLEALEERQLLTVAPAAPSETALVAEALAVTNDDALVTAEALHDSSSFDDVYFVADESSVIYETVKYMDCVNGEFVEKTAFARVVTSDMDGCWGEGFYVVQDALTINNAAVWCQGDVKLILADGCSLTIKAGDAKAGINVNGSNSLTIYGQQNQTGTLTAKGGDDDDGAAGIGGNYNQDGGNVTITGGSVYAYAYGTCPAIGGKLEDYVSNIKINVALNAQGRKGEGKDLETIPNTGGDLSKILCDYTEVEVTGAALTGVTISVTVKVGETLTAAVASGANATYAWYRSGKDAAIGRGATYTITTEDVGHTLTVKATGCNGYSGEVSATTKTVPTTLANPENFHTTSITEESITVSWNAVPHASGYSLEYKAFNSEKWEVVPNLGAQTTWTVDGLDVADRTYQLRVKALGIGDYVDSNYAQITVTSYLDADGQTKFTEALVVDGSTSSQEWKGWYVVEGALTMTDANVWCKDEVHLILADGCNFTISGKSRAAGIEVVFGTLTVYGQKTAPAF